MSDKPSTKKSPIAARANAVAVEAGGAAGVTFDPTIIVTIITALLKVFGVCGKSPAQAAVEMKAPGRLAHFVVRRECRRAVSDREQADALVEAVFDQAAKVNESEVAAMYAEAGVS